MKYTYLKSLFILSVLVLNGEIFSQPFFEIVPGLQLEELTPHVYRHISWMQWDDGTRIECNGMLYINKGEAAIFDTPMYDSLCRAMIDWITVEKVAKIKAVIVNHFHFDCNGGLGVFHERGIQSYALEGGCELAKSHRNPCGSNHFPDSLILTIGGDNVINRHFGHAHAPDAIFSYIPSEEVLYGGCSVKSLNAGKGNLEDADTKEWPRVIERVEKTFPEARVIIPGHGKSGGHELLGYTKAMFAED